MRWFRPSLFATLLYPGALFRIETSEKMLVLTFDDGPDPESTPFLLDILRHYGIKVLFFCNGSAAEKYPDLIAQIISEGHIIGNHGYFHLDGWKTICAEYCSNVYSAEIFTSDILYRPPYGNLKICQFRKLKKKYRIIMWDVMAYDFDPSFGHQKSLAILKKKIRPGSIIVLHDTTSSTCRFFLSEFIYAALSEGYKFELID